MQNFFSMLAKAGLVTSGLGSLPGLGGSGSGGIPGIDSLTTTPVREKPATENSNKPTGTTENPAVAPETGQKEPQAPTTEVAPSENTQMQTEEVVPDPVEEEPLEIVLKSHHQTLKE